MFHTVWELDRFQTALLCWNVVKFVRWEIGETVLICMTKKNKISAPSQMVATVRIALKVCQDQPQHLAHNVPNYIQIGSFLAEL